MNGYVLPVHTGPDKDRSYDGDYMERGKKAEEIVIAFLKRRPMVLNVIDFRELRQAQGADFDVGIVSIDGRVPLAEIKSDAYLGKTGNVLFEVLRINHTCDPDFSATLGWSARTPARYILVYAPSVEKIYQFDTNKWRKCFQKYTLETRKNMRISIVETDRIKTTINILMPISFCAGSYVIHEVTNG
jgi:predicted nucleotidyltransferase